MKLNTKSVLDAGAKRNGRWNLSQKIEQILTGLGPAYIGWKENEAEKDKLKKEFFEAITEEFEGSDTLAEKVVEIEGLELDDARDLAVKLNPGWTVIAERPHPDTEGWWEFVVQEDPAFQPFTIDYEGVTFQRQVVSGSVYVDDKRLRAEDPELWEQITFVPPLPSRKLRPLDDLEPELQARVQKYMYEGTPTVKFPAPKVVKE